ncbi:MAG: ABC transporter permease [Acidimicrobiia bacterium]|jgi:peptide/nickel transport system permease protein
MPEPLSSPAEQLATEEAHEGLPIDSSTQEITAVIAAPEAGAARKKFGIGAWLALGWLVFVIGLALLAPWLPLKDPINWSDPSLKLEGPQWGHLLGLDQGGHDMLSLLVWGARPSLVIGFGSIAIGFVVGGILGLISGYFRGLIGELLGGLFDIMLAIPAVILALAIVAASSASVTENTGSHITNVTVALAIVSVPILGRITRASALSWSEREFVLAARAQGASHFRIMVRELLPNVLPAMFSIAVLGIAVAIVAEGALAILGAGVNAASTPSWGNIIVGGQGSLSEASHIVIEASIAIFLTVLSLNHLGDALRARFDVREALI